MQLRNLGKNTEVIRNQTVNGLSVVASLVASANNTDIPDTNYNTGLGFDPAAVQIDVQLRRNGKTKTLISTNLGILGHFSTLTIGANQWYKGTVTKKKGSSVKQELDRILFIPFYGHLNIKGTDELVITVNMGRGTFGTGVDAALSSIIVNVNQSIGVETEVHSFHTYSIQINQNDDRLTLGDNVMRVALVSFEKDGSKQIFKSASLGSDRLDWTLIEPEMRLKHYQFFPYNYADALISVTQGEDQRRYFPNSYLVHDKDEIDQAVLNFSTESVNVASSQNLVCWVSYETSREIIQKAVAMEQKHTAENLSKVPQTLN